MKKAKNVQLVEPVIESKIYIIRGKKVMLDFDLAILYEVETGDLNQAVKRNIQRFPSDFMFQLTKEEYQSLLISQIVISNEKRGGRRRSPFAFTEQGIAMLSSVLKSERAIAVNIQIMRTFTKLRAMLSHYKELREKIEELEKKYDNQFKAVFEAIQILVTEESKPKERVGFRTI